MASSTVREHLREVHKVMAEHHGRMAAMAKTKKDKEAQAEHEDMAEFHEQMAEKCDAMPANKAMNGNDLVPDRVSGVLPEFPGIRAVTRAGQPNMPTKPNVPLEFEKLVSVEDDA